jgi:ribosomal protein L37AE/L43A
MTFKNFYDKYNDEDACKLKFKELREQEGVSCKKCKHTEHYWKSDKSLWQCKKCNFRTSLRSGTVMENSKLPFHYWFVAMQFLTVNKKSFSSLSVQKELKHKRYEPIWAMMHKLRAVMGMRDAQYQLTEAFLGM